MELPWPAMTAKVLSRSSAPTQAVGIYRVIGDQIGAANALTYLGAVLDEAGDYEAALEALAQARDIHDDTENRIGRANVLNLVIQLNNVPPRGTTNYYEKVEIPQTPGTYTYTFNVSGTAVGISRYLFIASADAEEATQLEEAQVDGLPGSLPQEPRSCRRPSRALA